MSRKRAWKRLFVAACFGVLVGGLALGFHGRKGRQGNSGAISTTQLSDGGEGVGLWFGTRQFVKGGCRQFPPLDTTAEPVSLTLDTARWDEAVMLRVDRIEACRNQGSVADEVLRVTVLRHVGGVEDRGLGVRRIAQLGPGSLGSDWPLRELVVGDEVLALLGPADPAAQGQDPLPFVGLTFDVAHHQATSRYTWFKALRGPSDEGAGPYNVAFIDTDLETAIRAAEHGLRS